LRHNRSQAVLRQSGRHSGDPEKITTDKSRANQAAIDGINNNRGAPTEVRQIKYLNNIVEQDHRAIKRMTKPMLNFKSFRSARSVLASIELMHMIRKGQMAEENQMPFAEQFYALAG
jgi:putative transposase